MKTFRPEGLGIELNVSDIKGKDYMEVAQRLLWFRTKYPEWTVQTEFLQLDIKERFAIARATISDESGRVIATATKHENAQGFPDYIEKAETGSIGRALALCGFGTQFAEELEEGTRIVDSPQRPTLTHSAPQWMPEGEVTCTIISITEKVWQDKHYFELVTDKGKASLWNDLEEVYQKEGEEFTFEVVHNDKGYARITKILG